MFSTNITDIERVLISQKKTDSRTILSLLREEDIDHQIELEEIDEKESKVF